MSSLERVKDAAKRPALGFFAGAAFLFRGIGQVVKTPAIWPAAMVPVLAAFLVSIAVAYLGHAALHALFPALFAETSSTWGGIGQALLRIFAYVLLGLSALFLGVSLAQPISGPALDSIARSTRSAIEGTTRDYPQTSFVASTLRSLRVTSVTLLLGIPIVLLLTVIELLFPPAAIVTWPCKLVVTGLLATWDLIDYPMSLDGRGVRERTEWLLANRSYALGFGLSFALMTVIPFVGLFLLPCGVAGATMLLHAERADSLSKKP